MVEAIDRRDGVEYAGLVLNERGYDRLRETQLNLVALNFAATDSFSRRNANASLDEALGGVGRTVSRARGDGVRTSVSISVAFGCPFEGAVAPERVLGLAEEAVERGAEEIIFADTIGAATPTQVRRLVVEAAKWARPVGRPLPQHTLHGLCECVGGARAWGNRLRRIGRRPQRLPVRTEGDGDIATEDLVYLLHGRAWRRASTSTL